MTGTTFAQQTPENDDAFAREVIAEINAWRVNMGLWPFQINPQLEEMAIAQSTYLVTETEIPQKGGDFHIDRNGKYPRDRAAAAPYNWPVYNNPRQILIGENAGVGSVEFVINYWRKSSVHNSTIVNPDYREIGVAAMPIKNSTDRMVIVVFGGRPNVLPTLINPKDGTLYLSNDLSTYSSQGKKWLHEATTVQLFDANDKPLINEPVPWQRTMTLPSGARGTVIVHYTDGNIEVESEVKLSQDFALLPGFTDVAATTPATTTSTTSTTTSSSTASSAPRTFSFSTLDSTVLEQYPDQDREKAFELLAEINAWRIRQGLWPLRANITLEVMALEQADYLLKDTQIPAQGGDFNAGPNGDQPPERARAEPYNWPTYDEPDQIVIGENAAVGTVSFALRFWRQSLSHYQNALNPAYREVGVAALPYESDQYLFIMVFGGRPNVLPALYDPAMNTLYLSNERSPFAANGEGWITEASQVFLFDAEGRPIFDGWIPWEAKITLPDIGGDKLFVLYSNDAIQTLTEVYLERDVAMVPSS